MIVSWTTSSMERSSKYDKLCNQMRSKNFTNEIFAFKVAGNSFFETPKDSKKKALKNQLSFAVKPISHVLTRGLKFEIVGVS